jgi:hypothetical protein
MISTYQRQPRRKLCELWTLPPATLLSFFLPRDTPYPRHFLHLNRTGSTRSAVPTSMPTAIQHRPSAVIPHTKRSAKDEDLSRAVILRGRGPKDPLASTSSRAIVLRHGRHGIWGDGKLAAFKKLSGQEKLALKAGTYLPTSRPIVRSSNRLAPDCFELTIGR